MIINPVRTFLVALTGNTIDGPMIAPGMPGTPCAHPVMNHTRMFALVSSFFRLVLYGTKRNHSSRIARIFSVAPRAGSLRGTSSTSAAEPAPTPSAAAVAICSWEKTLPFATSEVVP